MQLSILMHRNLVTGNDDWEVNILACKLTDKEQSKLIAHIKYVISSAYDEHEEVDDV